MLHIALPAEIEAGTPPTTTAALGPAVLGGPERLSSGGRAEIRTLSGHRPLRFMAELALNWGVIAATVSVGLWASNPFVTALCIVVVGIRQRVLGLLLHEQVHRLGLRGRHGDRIVNALVVYPLFATTVEDYAKVHLAHHKYFMTKKDPDFVRKSGADWTFPMSLRQLLALVGMDLTGLNTVQLVKGKTAGTGMEEFRRPHPTPRWFRLAWLVSLAAALSVCEAWGLFALYWVLPILTVTQVCVRWTAAMEHRYNHEGAELLQVTPLIRLTRGQRLMFPDLNFALHAYHHLHPGISFSNLPRVHEIYRRAGLVDERAVFDGQAAFLKSLIRPPRRRCDA